MNVIGPAALSRTPVSTLALRPAPELCLVVPTYNERANVPILIERLRNVLVSCDWEIVFVDDNSPDNTAALIRTIGEADSRVRCIRRIGRRGLAGACVEGMLSNQARYIAILDADLQHDESMLISMLDRLRRGDVDIVVASRYLLDDPPIGLSPLRDQLSRWSNHLVRRFLKIDLTDPMSGFFLIRRDVFESLAPAISSQGFKILLDILATGGSRLRAVELPTLFQKRRNGESKLDSKIALDFAALLTAKLARDAVSPRFLLFCLVGMTGLGVHLMILGALLAPAIVSFGVAQVIATIGAITSNFLFNNHFTYYDQRLTGWHFLSGLIWFQVICAIGAISNVGIAAWMYDYDARWWIAGLAGALIGTVWNYVVSAAFIWHHR